MMVETLVLKRVGRVSRITEVNRAIYNPYWNPTMLAPDLGLLGATSVKKEIFGFFCKSHQV